MKKKKKNQMKVSESEIDSIYTKCLNSAIRYIAYKQRTCSEISQKIEKYLSNYKRKRLIDDKASEDIKKRIVTELKEQKLFNDEAYARLYVDQKSQAKNPSSKLEIKNFLYKKGVSRDIIDKSLEKYTVEMEKINIQKVIEKKNKKSGKKLIAYLLRRGFTSSFVYELVDY